MVTRSDGSGGAAGCAGCAETTSPGTEMSRRLTGSTARRKPSSVYAPRRGGALSSPKITIVVLGSAVEADAGLGRVTLELSAVGEHEREPLLCRHAELFENSARDEVV